MDAICFLSGEGGWRGADPRRDGGIPKREAVPAVVPLGLRLRQRGRRHAVRPLQEGLRPQGKPRNRQEQAGWCWFGHCTQYDISGTQGNVETPITSSIVEHHSLGLARRQLSEPPQNFAALSA